MSVYVVAHITAKPDTVDQVQPILEGLLEPTRNETGCTRYQLFQNAADPTDFTFTEEWASAAALEAHLASSHVTAAVGRVHDLLAAPPDIRTYDLLG